MIIDHYMMGLFPSFFFLSFAFYHTCGKLIAGVTQSLLFQMPFLAQTLLLEKGAEMLSPGGDQASNSAKEYITHTRKALHVETSSTRQHHYYH